MPAARRLSFLRRNAFFPTARLRRVLHPPANPAVWRGGRQAVQFKIQNEADAQKNKNPHCRICGKRAARWRRVKKWRPFDCFKSAKHSFYRRRRADPANCALTEFSSSRLGKVSKLPLLALAASVAAFLCNFFGKSCAKNNLYQQTLFNKGRFQPFSHRRC